MDKYLECSQRYFPITDPNQPGRLWTELIKALQLCRSGDRTNAYNTLDVAFQTHVQSVVIVPPDIKENYSQAKSAAKSGDYKAADRFICRAVCALAAQLHPTPDPHRRWQSTAIQLLYDRMNR